MRPYMKINRTNKKEHGTRKTRAEHINRVRTMEGKAGSSGTAEWDHREQDSRVQTMGYTGSLNSVDPL